MALTVGLYITVIPAFSTDHGHADHAKRLSEFAFVSDDIKS